MISFICGIQKKKKDTNELIYKTETDSQAQKTNLQLPKGKCCGRGRVEMDKSGAGDEQTHNTIRQIKNCIALLYGTGTLLNIL